MPMDDRVRAIARALPGLHPDGRTATVTVRLRNPDREVEARGPLSAAELCRELGLVRESVLVICGGELVTGDRVLTDGDVVEIRPVISGGAR
jgi:sulfur carrier protein